MLTSWRNCVPSLIWVLIGKLAIPGNTADDILTDCKPSRRWYSVAGRIFFVLDAMMRSVGRVELLYENQSWCIMFFYLARARILHVAKETVVFFSSFFPFERFRYRCSLIHRVRLYGQSGTRTDASAALHFWFNTHTTHIIIPTRQAVPAIIIIIITIRRPREILWKSV